MGEIVRRHETLRTVFAEVDGSPVQVIAPFDGFVLPVEDLSGLSEADREAAVGRRAGEEARRPFDLSAGPLFRAALLRLGAEDHVLLLGMHHIVSDGWSMGVLSRELSALYAAYREGVSRRSPELAVQYADYAVWQREQLEGEVLERQLAYWTEQLAGAPELLELPTDRPRPPVRTYRGASVPVELSPELLERLQALGRSEGATLYMTLLAAFQVLLSKYARQRGRGGGQPDRRAHARGGGGADRLLRQHAGAADRPLGRPELPRGAAAGAGSRRWARTSTRRCRSSRLVAELQPERSLSHSPLFQVMFTLQNAGGGGGALPGLSVSGVGAERASAKFDLSLTLAATAAGLARRAELQHGPVRARHGRADAAATWSGCWSRSPRTRTCGSRSWSCSAGGARASCWRRGTGTEAEYPADRCIHELFEAQAARTPDAVALVCEDRSLTYARAERAGQPAGAPPPRRWAWARTRVVAMLLRSAAWR